MDTQILKLNEPYEYIHCNGSIGLHIATMIVYEAKVNDNGDYELVTHSHPVVKYRNRPSGTVWNRAELTDCTVLCREDNKHITMSQFYDFVKKSANIRLEGKDEEHDLLTMNIAWWKFTLDMHGIEIEWPMEKVEGGKQRPAFEFEVGLEFEEAPEGSKFKYICYDIQYSDVTPLYVHFGFNTRDELKANLSNVMVCYYSMFKDHMFRISFAWPIETEFNDVSEEVNRLEKEIREHYNDIDV